MEILIGGIWSHARHGKPEAVVAREPRYSSPSSVSLHSGKSIKTEILVDQ